MIFILILNRPRFEDHPVKTKSNIAQVETQALHNIDKPVIDVSGWQRPEEINYDTLSQNISGAIVRVHSGAQTSKENDASYVNGVDKAFKTHITEFQKRNVPVGVYAYLASEQSLNHWVLKISESTLGSTSWKSTVLIQISLRLFGFLPMVLTQDFTKLLLKLI